MNETTHKKPNTKQASETPDNPELAAYGLANEHEDARKQEEEIFTEHAKSLLYNVTNAAREKSHYASDATRERAQGSAEKPKKAI
ncbi:hypothetical protein [Armatimonas rosea]|uniref:Uncharacterized protein n=1 Tax=Armatimonas rosea TaxID=685828 RepID=A0A7W9SQ61_ARMRO|nr:hypothetical protein [Armatimonas rosea]MBB6050786.1 hypothetical protein [Armatimonas rosea]